MTDEEIGRHVQEPKRMVGKPRIRNKPGHMEVDCNLVGDTTGANYVLWVRRNSRIPDEDFTAGLRLRTSEGDLVLRRFNGSSHEHVNHLDGTSFDESCHIHSGSSRYLEQLGKIDGYAEVTTRYADARGALAACIGDCYVHDVDVDSLLLLSQADIPGLLG